MPILRLHPKTRRLFWGFASTLTLLLAILLFTFQAINQARYSASAEAQITRKWTEHIIGTRGGEYMLLEFVYQPGFPNSSRDLLQLEGRIYNFWYYQTLQVNGPLPLLYDPNHPGDVFFRDDANPYDIALRFILPFIVLLGSVYCFFNFLWAD